MSKNIKDLFAKDLNKRERACFESGIKLGALYHILCGIPISSNKEVISSIEKGIEAAISCQPYVKSVKVRLNRENIKGTKSNPFDYDEITGKVIRADLELVYENIDISAKIDWIKNMEYPLMYIEKITEK